MRTVGVFFIFLYSILLLHAEGELSITYKGMGRTYKETKNPYTVTYVLDIDGNKSHFYCPLYERQDDVIDSLLKSGYNAYEVMDEIRKQNLVGKTTPYNVFKNYPEQGKIILTDVILKKFQYKESMPKMDWTLEETDSIIAGYHCFKATTKYRGRTWTAFYTMDILVNDGPWKLYGLPGLILYARDSKNDFSFDCIGIEKGCKRPIIIREAKYKQCTAKELCSLKRLYAKSYTEFVYRTSGDRPQRFDANGRPLKEVPKTACLLEIIE